MNEHPVSSLPTPPSGQGRRRSRRTLGLLIALLVAVGTAIVPGTGALPAEAATDPNTITQTTLGKFDPGNLISDEVFFTGSALSAGQIQTFLSSKVTKCAATDGPACLRSYRQTTPNRPADAYCKAYGGVRNELASTIIGKVSKACGVSAKVLLVLLQKEQSLVTSTAPTERQYRSATGFACPDSAPCDEQYYGFFNQVYSAARQYKRYAVVDAYSWFPVGVATNIQYHPNKSCGTQRVLIKNRATAGLYYYTPYVPNAAALANLNGNGDLSNPSAPNCSSFGNRNFWRGFTEWFGSTDIAVTGTVQKAWLANGGLQGAFGKQRKSQVCSSSGRYCVQTFAGGTLAANGSAGIAMPSGAARTAWVKQKSQNGALGWPKKALTCRKKDNTCVQTFTGGYVAQGPVTGTRVVSGGLAKAWKASKGRDGALKMPRAAARCTKAGTRCTQKFQGGYATTHTSYGNRAVVGLIADRWVKSKGTKGSLGWPTKNQKCSKVKGGKACYQYFSGGAISSHPQYKTRALTGKIGAAWVKAQKSGKSLGWATGARTCSTKKGVKTCTQKFTKGKITYKGKGAAKIVRSKR